MINFLAQLLFRLADLLFSLSLFLHHTFNTPWWRQTDAAIQRAEERVEELQQFQYLSETRGHDA